MAIPLQQSTVSRSNADIERVPAWVSVLSYSRRNPHLLVGLVILLTMTLFGLVGPFFLDLSQADPLSAMDTSAAPSLAYPFGTDDVGRNLIAVMMAAVPRALGLGLLAGTIGLGIGIILGFISGYIGGWIDNIISSIVDILLTVPGLVLLISIAATLRTSLSVVQMALIVASLAWMFPTRTIRSQVLSMRERGYVQMAKLNGMNTLEIIFSELLPNLLPYLGAALVGSVTGAIFASLGLELLGLGPQSEPTIGMTIYWAITNNAMVRGMWWWWGGPVLFIVLLFVSLFLVSAGLDEIANPRARRSM